MFLLNLRNIMHNVHIFHVDSTFYLSSEFFLLAANKGTSCVIGFISEDQQSKPTQYYILSVVISSTPVVVVNNVSLIISGSGNVDDGQWSNSYIGNTYGMGPQLIASVGCPYSNNFHQLIASKSVSLPYFTILCTVKRRLRKKLWSDKLAE